MDKFEAQTDTAIAKMASAKHPPPHTHTRVCTHSLTLTVTHVFLPSPPLGSERLQEEK